MSYYPHSYPGYTPPEVLSAPSGVQNTGRTVTRVDFTDGNGNCWERRDVPLGPRPVEVEFEAFRSWVHPTFVFPVLMSGSFVVERMAKVEMTVGEVLTVSVPKGQTDGL